MKKFISFSVLTFFLFACNDKETVNSSNSDCDSKFCRLIKITTYEPDGTLLGDNSYRWECLKEIDEDGDFVLFNKYGEFIKEEYISDGITYTHEYEYTDCDNFCKLTRESDYENGSLVDEDIYTWEGNTQTYKYPGAASYIDITEHNELGYETKNTRLEHPQIAPNEYDYSVTDTFITTTEYLDCNDFCKVSKITSYNKDGSIISEYSYLWDGLLQINAESPELRTLYNKYGEILRDETYDFIEEYEYTDCE